MILLWVFIVGYGVMHQVLLIICVLNEAFLHQTARFLSFQ